MITSVIFSIVETKPNIIFAIFVVYCFRKNLNYFYIKAVKTILKYPQKTKNQGIIYNQSFPIISKYLDSDWVDDKNNQKSTFSYIFILNEDLIR